MKDDLTAIEVTLARSWLYRLLSAAFLYPEGDPLSPFGKGLDEVKGLLDGEGGLRGVLEALASSLEGVTLQDLQAEHRRVFGHLISQECPPYETQYGCSHIFQQAQMLGDIAAFYRAFGLEVAEQAKERLDHIAVELEFMHVLTYKEAYAMRHHGPEKARVCREAQRTFLDEHLGRWAPVFARRLGRKAGSGFYKALAELASAFLAFEVRLLGARPLELQEGDLTPLPSEVEGDCFSCGVRDFCFDG